MGVLNHRRNGVLPAKATFIDSSSNSSSADFAAQSKDIWSTDTQEFNSDPEDEQEYPCSHPQVPRESAENEYEMMPPNGLHQTTQTEEGVHPGKQTCRHRSGGSVGPFSVRESYDRDLTPSALSPTVFTERGSVPFPPVKYDL